MFRETNPSLFNKSFHIRSINLGCFHKNVFIFQGSVHIALPARVFLWAAVHKSIIIHRPGACYPYSELILTEYGMIHDIQGMNPENKENIDTTHDTQKNMKSSNSGLTVYIFNGYMLLLIIMSRYFHK